MNGIPRTESARLDASEFSEWGTGPTNYCHIDDMAKLERENNQLRAALAEIEEKSTEAYASQMAKWALDRANKAQPEISA